MFPHYIPNLFRVSALGLFFSASVSSSSLAGWARAAEPISRLRGGDSKRAEDTPFAWGSQHTPHTSRPAPPQALWNTPAPVCSPGAQWGFITVELTSELTSPWFLEGRQK